jgi:hypothetical protein
MPATWTEAAAANPRAASAAGRTEVFAKTSATAAEMAAA